MLAKPGRLIGRDQEWKALSNFVEREQRLALVYGPRRIGKSYLIEALVKAAGGLRYQAPLGTPGSQLQDFGRTLGEWLGAGPLQLNEWQDALERLERVDAPFVALDEAPYLFHTSPELPSLIQRYVDSGTGPPMILSGSSLSVMASLLEANAPLYGRASMAVVPRPLNGADLSRLWGVDSPSTTLAIDAVLGGLPGYRPLLPAPGPDLDRWFIEELLAPSSPLLDAAEAALAEVGDPSALHGTHRAILAAIASGNHAFSAISRAAGLATGALSRPLATLERAGVVMRIPDPMRSRRDRYELADPHVKFWLSIIEPNRSRLQAGHAEKVWGRVRETTWPSQALRPRWEMVVREHLELHPPPELGTVDRIGVTEVPDPHSRASHEVDIVAMDRDRVVAIGEAKLRAMGTDDVDRLLRIRELLGTPDAAIVLASASGFDLDTGAYDQVRIVQLDAGDIYR